MRRKGERMLIPIKFAAPEANDVLRQVRMAGVKITLDVPTAIEIIEKFLQQYKQSYWYILILEIGAAIRKELRKPWNPITIDSVKSFIKYLETPEEGPDAVEGSDKEAGGSDERDGGPDEEDHEYTDLEDGDGSGDDSKLVEEGSKFDDDEEGSDFDDDEGSEFDDDEEDSGFDQEDSASDDDVSAQGKREVEITSEEKEEEEDFRDPHTREVCLEDLSLVCGRLGLMVEPGDQVAILDEMYPYIRGAGPFYRREIRIFMERMRKYIDTLTTLDDCRSVEAALKRRFFDEVYGKWRIVKSPGEEGMADAKDPFDQQLKKNMVPTKVEGISSRLNQIKPEEKRECVDIMETEEMETDPLEPVRTRKRKYGQ